MVRSSPGNTLQNAENQNNAFDISGLLEWLKLENPEIGKKIKDLEWKLKESQDPEDIYAIKRELYRTARLELAKSWKIPWVEKEKVQKILKNRTIDDARASDMLLLGRNGMNLSSSLLSDSIDPSKDIWSDKMYIGQKVVVNFGINEKINNTIGAGDIMPIEVLSIKMIPKNPKQKDKDQREWEWRAGPRPGFYDKRGYIPVYDGDIIEVVRTREVTPELQKQWDLAKSNRFREVRIDDMINSWIKSQDDPRLDAEFTDLMDDQNIASGIEKELKEREARKEFYRKHYGLDTMNRISFEAKFGDFVNKTCENYSVPVALVMWIFSKETIGWFQFNQVSSAKAFGIWQITPDTWLDIKKRIWKNIQEENPFDQIEAAIENLSYHKKWSTDWTEAAIKYHTGAWANASHLESYKAQNNAIANLMKNDTWDAYREAVADFYGIKNIDLAYKINIDQYKVSKMSDIKSFAWVIKENGMTYCSRTTRLDAESMFGVTIPQAWSALDSGDLYTRDSYHKNQVGIADGNNAIESAPKNANFADIILYSNTRNGGWNWNDEGNGHRCLAFKSEGVWYVLDPYNSANEATPFPEYFSGYKNTNGADIKKIAFYSLPKDNIRDPRVAQKIDNP